ncbi:hypothetical protein [Frigoriglobus tundricola]|uniref:Uncharacterized protein n=1 Tax=Frigoriglobus tundricola TaxID=2774151 RepID=A0A6M5YJ15_9BACT|nr:hypothetical protein [Frigoriglobus tundricola]QJW93266.1 hypothetical protein FTUN_0771 [Frigoriglobus tundricola]
MENNYWLNKAEEKDMLRARMAAKLITVIVRDTILADVSSIIDKAIENEPARAKYPHEPIRS